MHSEAQTIGLSLLYFKVGMFILGPQFWTSLIEKHSAYNINKVLCQESF